MNKICHYLTFGFVLIVAVFLLGCQDKKTSLEGAHNIGAAFTPNAHAIIPAPASLKVSEGAFTFSASTALVINSEAVKPVAEYWANLFVVASGIQLNIAVGDVTTNSLTLRLIAASELGSDNTEAYRLIISPKNIVIEAASNNGLFYGLQSLRQLLPAEIESPSPINSVVWQVPALTIIDEPLYPYRGMHLDVARHFQPVWFIKRYIDLLAFHKMNRFHWHLTDDQGWRIPIDAYPKLIAEGAWRDKTVVGHTLDRDVVYDNKPTGGFYTKDQIREIVAYAAERQIMVIPEVDIPGHASPILAAYPEFGCSDYNTQVQPNFGIFPAVLCPTDSTFTMLRAVFTEVAALFPGDYIHVGGDEVLKEQWQASEFCTQLMAQEGLTDYHQLQSYFIRRVSDIVTGLDKKMLGWNEILDGGVAENATIMSWQGIEGGIAAAKMGHDAVMTPFAYTYFDFYQSRSIDEPMSIHGLSSAKKVYSYNPMPDELMGTEKAKHILGAQGQLWTEYIKTPRRAEFAVLPRMSALAEVVWTPREQQSWESFTTRLPNLYAHFDNIGVNAARSVYEVMAVAEKNGRGEDASHTISFSTLTKQIQVRYTLDGSLPNATSPLYNKPFTVNGNTLIRAKGQDILSGNLFGETQLRVAQHKAIGADVNLLSEASTDWNSNPALGLVDGVLKTDQLYQPDDWTVFYGNEVAIEISLPQQQAVSTVEFGFNPGRYRQMYPPTGLEVLTSVDGENWQSVYVAKQDEFEAAQNRIEINFDAVEAKVIKLIALNARQVIDTQTNTLTSVPLHFDEILIK